jgi:hypothetical protein
MTYLELSNEYHELIGCRADGRWSHDRLVQEVEKLREVRAVMKAKKEAEKEKRRVAKEICEARIAARGSLEEFIQYRNRDDLTEEDQKFAYALRRAVQNIEMEKSELEKFVVEVQKNPTYALSWSKGMFEVAGKAAVSREMIGWFEHGETYTAWIEYATKEALRRTRSPSMSTSPTSNLMDTYIAAAWADAANGFGW